MDKALEGVHSIARSDTFEGLACWGWLSKGVVHAIGSGPLAIVLLGVMCLGLAAYSLWRFVQASYDVDGEGSDLHGTLRRVSYTGTEVAYAMLTFTAVSALFSGGDGPDGEADYTGGRRSRWISRPDRGWWVRPASSLWAQGCSSSCGRTARGS